MLFFHGSWWKNGTMKYALLLSVLLFSYQNKSENSYTGSDYIKRCQPIITWENDNSKPTDNLDFGWCMGYVRGTMDSYGMIYSFMTNGALDGSKGPLGVCLPSDITNGQMNRVFIKYMTDHPDRLHFYIPSLALMAMHDSFPCKESK